MGIITKKKKEWQRKSNRPKRRFIKNHNLLDSTKKLFSPVSEEERPPKDQARLCLPSKTAKTFKEPDSILERESLTFSRPETLSTILDTELCGVRSSTLTDISELLEPVSERTSHLKPWVPTSELCCTQTKPCERRLSKKQ